MREEGWLDDEGFLGAMEISETLPGLNAVNMAIIMGDNLRGLAGAVVSVIGMLLPGSIVVMVLGILYQSNHDNPEVKRFLLGIAAAAVGLLSAVTLQIGRRQFRQLPDIAIIAVLFSRSVSSNCRCSWCCWDLGRYRSGYTVRMSQNRAHRTSICRFIAARIITGFGISQLRSKTA